MTKTQHNNTDGTEVQADNQEYSLDEDARSHEQAKEDHERALNRRTFIKAAAATGAAATGVGASTGSVAAQSDGGWIPDLPEFAPDNFAEGAVMSAAAGLPIVGGAASAGYFGAKAVADILSDLDDNPAASTVHDSIYNDALLTEKQVVEAINEAQNEIEQTAALSRAEAKAIAFKAISNGASQSEASTKATERIDQYYAGVQEAFYRAQEHSILQFESYITTINNTSNLSLTDVFKGSSSYSISNPTFSDVDVELIDGRTVTLRTLTVEFSGNTSSVGTGDAYYYGSAYTTAGLLAVNDASQYVYALNSSGDESSADDTASILTTGTESAATSQWGYNQQYTTYEAIDGQIKTARDNAQSDVSTIISDVFANYTQDQLSDVDDFISPIGRTLLSTEDFTQTGAPVYPQMVAGELGITTSQAGYSLTVEYEPSTAAGTDGNSGTSDDTFGSVQTLNGTLWGFKPSSGSAISTGTTYLTRADNASGNVAYFSEVTDSGEVVEHELDGRFTITDIKTGDGSSTDQVSVYDPTFTSADTSDLIQQIKNVIDRRQEEDKVAPQAPGGGGGGGVNGALLNLGIVGAVIAAVYAYLNSDDDSGR